VYLIHSTGALLTCLGEGPEKDQMDVSGSLPFLAELAVHFSSNVVGWSDSYIDVRVFHIACYRAY
jgi:hypothetical protein